MHILYVVHQFLPEFRNGTERFVYNVAKSMQRAGHTVEVLTCAIARRSWPVDKDGLWLTKVVDGIPVFAVPRSVLSSRAEYDLCPLTPAARAMVLAFLGARKIDVCHVAHTMRLYGILQCLVEFGIPYMVTLTDFFLPCYRINCVRLDGALCAGSKCGTECAVSCLTPEWSAPALLGRSAEAQAALNGADRVIACSEFVAGAYRREFPGLEILVQPHGVNFHLSGERDRRGNGEILTFGYLGTISDAKGVRELVRGFSEVPGRHLRLRVVGGLVDQAYGVAVLEAARYDDRISIEPPVDYGEVPKVLTDLDVLCVPSKVPETFSLALHEAFAAEVPAIVSDIGAIGPTVGIRGCGSVVEPGNAEAWANAIRQVAENPGIVNQWRLKIPLPLRVEEEAFFYELCYRQAGRWRASGFHGEIRDAK